ncbi:MAG: hypothetical protein H7197_10100 [Vitreoscilla sp.]|nr:hypothetical protein [Polaromonas sp.]
MLKLQNHASIEHALNNARELVGGAKLIVDLAGLSPVVVPDPLFKAKLLYRLDLDFKLTHAI